MMPAPLPGQEASSVRVFARFRPLNPRETQQAAEPPAYEFNEAKEVLEVQEDRNVKKVALPFERVFVPGETQAAVYQEVASDTVQDVLNGFNGTIFAYGQTGTGKTHTMMGERGDPQQRGIIPRVVEQLFDSIAEQAGEQTTTVTVEYLEVYRESLKDLCAAVGGPKLTIRGVDGRGRGLYVQGLSSHSVASADDVLAVLDAGEQQRAVAATRMNDASSRSHAVFTIIVRRKSIADGSTTEGKLNLVDLAGSEKVAKTGASGKTLQEARMINLSLSVLTNVIAALASKKKHVPYRDSVLTRLLQSSLGGNTKTSVVVACSPSGDSKGETASSLGFGKRAKSIQNVVQQNRHSGDLEDEVLQLRAQNAELVAALRAAGLAVPGEVTSDTPSRAASSTELQDLHSRVVDAEARAEAAEAEAQEALDQMKLYFVERDFEDPADEVTQFIANAMEGKVEQLATLLATGADVNAYDTGGNKSTALMAAAEMGQAKSIDVLLKYKAKLEMEDEVGWTALHFAAYNRQLECCQVLAAAGAELDRRDKTTLETPLALAVGFMSDETNTDADRRAAKTVAEFLAQEQERQGTLNDARALIAIWPTFTSEAETPLSARPDASMSPRTTRVVELELKNKKLQAFIEHQKPFISRLIAEHKALQQEHQTLQAERAGAGSSSAHSLSHTSTLTKKDQAFIESVGKPTTKTMMRVSYSKGLKVWLSIYAT